MEFLKEIDWSYRKPNPDRFIANKSSYKQSATIQLVQDTFNDPLLSIEDPIKPNEISSNKERTTLTPKKKKTKFQTLSPHISIKNDREVEERKSTNIKEQSPQLKFKRVSNLRSHSELEKLDIKTKNKRAPWPPQGSVEHDPEEEIIDSANIEELPLRYSFKYVPGLCKLPMHPQSSALTPKQHQLCVDVLLAKNNYCITMPKPKFSDSMLGFYNNLIPIIKEEQASFMEFVKSKWTVLGYQKKFAINDQIEKLFEEIIARRKDIFKKYPQYYKVASMLPLVYANQNIPIELEHLDDILTKYSLPALDIPNLQHKTTLSEQFKDGKNIRKRIGTNSSIVSEDENCEEFAIKYGADIVVSFSGLKVLANNQEPYNTHWILPVLVKSHQYLDSNGQKVARKIVYIDRSLPSMSHSNYDKTLTYYKYLMKTNFVKFSQSARKRNNRRFNKQQCNNCKPISDKNVDNEKIVVESVCKTTISEENIEKVNENPVSENTDSDDDDKLVIDLPNEVSPCEGIMTRSKKKQLNESTSPVNTPKKNINISATMEFTCNCKNSQLSDSSASSKTRQTYRLWRLGQIKEKNKLSKDVEADLKILVRCKQDAHETDENLQKKNYILAPKLEYQLEYGVEITQPNELAHQWTALKFNPNSLLLRARIKPDTGEVIMMEKLTLQNLSHEASKYPSWKPEKALGCFFNIFSRLAKLPEGQYMLNHDPQNHAFAMLYHEANNGNDAPLNLHEKCGGVLKLPMTNVAPWVPIDPCTVTPLLNHHKIMPAMFNPKQVGRKFPKKNASIPKKVGKKARTKTNKRKIHSTGKKS